MRFALLSFCLLSSVICAAEPSKPAFTILYTAESHAALLPCDCPLQPLGGVARRATLIKQFRARGPVVVIDGGGWSAGGMYDEDSDGDPKRDELRSKLISDSMRLMKYEHIVTGAESKVSEFAIPLQDEKLNVVISRLGEEETEKLARDSKAAIIFSAGRKTSQRESWKVGGSTLINFDYQARNLVVVDAFRSPTPGPAQFDFRVRLEALDKTIPDDPEIVELLAPHPDALTKKGRQLIEIEFWTMPECPGCKLARSELEILRGDFQSRVRITPHWVVEMKGGKLASLHGDRELNEARVQVLINKYYPEKIWAWLEWRAKNVEPAWLDGAAALNILAPRIEQALAAGEADALLAEDFKLAERRRIAATPSLVIGNRLYEGDIDRPHLLSALCGMLDAPKPDACKNAPACFTSAQCRKRGFDAKCEEPGTATARCSLTPARKIPVVVIFDKLALASNHERIMEALLNDLPGAEFILVDLAEPLGARLAEQSKIARLPAFLLEISANKESGFNSNLKGIAREISIADERGVEQKWLLLREDRNGVGANRLLARERVKGRADFFCSRFSKNGQEALETALACAASPEAAGLKLDLHDILYWKTNADPLAAPQLAAPNGLAELEEAARAMALRQLAPEKLNAYLIERGKLRGSSYWDLPLKTVGVDPEKIRALAEGPTRSVLNALEADATLLKSLDAGGDIVLLAENCELIPIASRKDLRHILERIAGRK